MNFAVVKPITGELLHQGFVSKYIDVYESPEEKKEREFEEKLENTLHIINYMVIKLSAMMFKVIHQLGSIH